MATNKQATIRYHALDRCFNNHYRKYYIDDLIEACNQAIYDFAGITNGVKKRQVFDDITFMESQQGWSIPLERIKDGRRVYYRYLDKSFSINNQGINQGEAEQLKETLVILSRFKGLPHFEWVEEMRIRLEDTFKLKGSVRPMVGFEQNPFLKGLDFFTAIFNAIQNEVALTLKYKSYKQDKSIQATIHPWYLKQYNTRWFLFGFNGEFGTITNFALDRILEIKESKVTYIKNNEINFEEYFEDVIGVTVRKDVPIEIVLLKISNEIWPYIESKPLHGSQKIKNKTKTDVIIQLSVQVNYELIALLFSYMDKLEVIEPESLRARFKNISNLLFKKYL